MTTVVTLDAEHESGWERFVQSHAAGLVYYSLRFRDLLVELTHGTPQYLVVLKGGEVVGGLPVMALEGSRGRVFNSLPYFGSPGSPLAVSTEVSSALLRRYEELASGPNVLAATLIENPLAPIPAPAHDLVDTRIGHLTPLQGNGPASERLLQLIEPSARRNVKKAIRAGTVVRSEPESFDVLQRLHAASMHAIGAVIKSPDFFSAVPSHLRANEDFDLFVGRIDGDAVAALLVFYAARTVEYYVPATNPASRSLQPMAVVLLHAMTNAAERGYESWNWGGSWPTHTSLQRFKAKWGGRSVEYRYWTRLNDPALLQATRDEIQAAYPGFFVLPFAALETRV